MLLTVLTSSPLQPILAETKIKTLRNAGRSVLRLYVNKQPQVNRFSDADQSITNGRGNRTAINDYAELLDVANS